MKVMKLLIFSLLLISTSVSFASLESRKIDSFGAIDCEDEMARLDNFAIELQNAPDAQGYIFVYGGRRDTKRDEVQVRGSRMKRYLVENRGVSAHRVRLLNSGYRENFTVELWLVPRDDSAPTATPTVKERGVRFKRGRMDRYREPGCFPGKYVVPKARPA
jgi:hypothetical protein